MPKSRPSRAPSTRASSATRCIHEHVRSATRRSPRIGPTSYDADGRARRGARGRQRGQGPRRRRRSSSRPRCSAAATSASCERVAERDRRAARRRAPASTPTTTCPTTSRTATRTRSPSTSSRTSSRASRAPTSRPPSSSAPPTQPGVTENVEKVHRACARASVQTGAPIMAHSRAGRRHGPRQIEIFLEEGVAPEKIQIAHCGDTPRPRLRRVRSSTRASTSASTATARDVPADRAAQRDGTAELLRRGHAERLFIVAGLLRDDRLVPARGGRGDGRPGRGQGLVDDARLRRGAARAARARACSTRRPSRRCSSTTRCAGWPAERRSRRRRARAPRGPRPGACAAKTATFAWCMT